MRDRPVISGGCDKPNNVEHRRRNIAESTVRFDLRIRVPIVDIDEGHGVERMSRVGRPVAGSFISSQLPWSAVMAPLRPARASRSTMRFTPASTASTARMAASSTPV